MVNFRRLFIVLAVSAILALVGLLRLDIDTDVVHSLPLGDPVVADGLEIFAHHPIHDQIAVDLTVLPFDRAQLIAAGDYLKKGMQKSGLFAQVGMDDIGTLIPELAVHVVQTLPLLFSREELEELVAPRLQKEWISQHFQELHQSLSGMEGIGLARFIGSDPLNLKDLVLARMVLLAPTQGADFQQGHLLSPDGRHLLITARPLAGSTDTASARRIAVLFDSMRDGLAARYQDHEIVITPVGAYRAGLDNEQIIRRDVNLALLLVTAGIALLLLVSFPRPLVGLLSLVPALAGTGAALFVYSLLYPDISIMVLGFGGALISITVDHGIAYLLFLDRSGKASGRKASHEVRAIGIMAVLTTIGAFLILGFSGFPIFTELGRFTALGILCSFLFVHLVFPSIFIDMPPAAARRPLLQRLVDFLYNTGKIGLISALALFCGLFFFARPQFHVSLDSMNTVSEQTTRADALFTRVWGDISSRIFLMDRADSIAGLQDKDDQLLGRINRDVKRGVLATAFVPSMLFPGRELAARNLSAWHNFWTPARVAHLRRNLTTGGTGFGFTPNAYHNFFRQLESGFTLSFTLIPERFFKLLAISRPADQAKIIQFITLQPGKHYGDAAFFSRYHPTHAVFDAGYFSKRLAKILFSTFGKMLLILSISLILLLFLVYLNLSLTILTLLPVIFAYICTLGTLHLLGRSIDIPGLMLSIIILGMGIDYSIFFVRAHQRYRDVNAADYGLVRSTVFLAAASTLIGFGVLCFAEHSLLRSIGIISLLGIGYSLLGAFLLLPPLLNIYFDDQDQQKGRATRGNKDIFTRVRDHYRTMEAYPRMFARFKLRLDPMFTDLPKLLAGEVDDLRTVHTIIDIGCGYGVPACWCLEFFPCAAVYGIDPDPERVRVADLATGDRGRITCARAPEMPAVSQPADIILILDMLHYLDDRLVRNLFENCRQALAPGGILVIRFVVRPEKKVSWSWHLEDMRVRWSGNQAHYRSVAWVTALLEASGLQVVVGKITDTDGELAWIVARRPQRMQECANC